MPNIWSVLWSSSRALAGALRNSLFFFAYSTSPGEAAASSEPLWGCAWHPKQCQTGNGICDMEREECAIYRSQWHPGKNNRGTTGISGGNWSPWANRDVEIPFSWGRLKQGGHRVSVPYCGATCPTPARLKDSGNQVCSFSRQSWNLKLFCAWKSDWRVIFLAEVRERENTSAGCKSYGKESFRKAGIVFKISRSVTRASSRTKVSLPVKLQTRRLQHYYVNNSSFSFWKGISWKPPQSHGMFWFLESSSTQTPSGTASSGLNQHHAMVWKPGTILVWAANLYFCQKLHLFGAWITLKFSEICRTSPFPTCSCLCTQGQLIYFSC